MSQHSINNLLSLKDEDNHFSILKIDFSSAFNLVDREAMFEQTGIKHMPFDFRMDRILLFRFPTSMRW